ncbi:MAG: hypothetical protein QM680_00745 [Luteolibacter sp.]
MAEAAKYQHDFMVSEAVVITHFLPETCSDFRIETPGIVGVRKMAEDRPGRSGSLDRLRNAAAYAPPLSGMTRFQSHTFARDRRVPEDSFLEAGGKEIGFGFRNGLLGEVPEVNVAHIRYRQMFPRAKRQRFLSFIGGQSAEFPPGHGPKGRALDWPERSDFRKFPPRDPRKIQFIFHGPDFHGIEMPRQNVFGGIQPCPHGRRPPMANGVDNQKAMDAGHWEEGKK